MKRNAFLGAALFLLIAAACLFAYVIVSDDDEESQHYSRGETEVVLASLSNASMSLYRAGKTLRDANVVPASDLNRLWLSAGNYFIKTTAGVREHYTPIPLTGFRCGPDADGAFLVTLRPAPKDYPPTLSNSGSEFLYIPSGNFLLGDRNNPLEPHYVWLTGYFIASFEVTNEEFRAFISAADGYRNDANWSEAGRQWKASSRSQVTALLSEGHPLYRRFGQSDQPVTLVTWYEAHAFCRWLTRAIGRGNWLYSLPTDAEWEKAARGPDNFDYGLSMTVSDAEAKLYNWKKNPDADTTVIGIHDTPQKYLANRYGLYHMTGNVVEWTQSIDRSYNKKNPWAEDERNHDDSVGRRTARGGSWYSASIAYLYIPYRDAFQREHSTQDVGFRLVAKRLP